MTYKTYMPKTHQLFCRICKKQNKMGESIIDVFGEVHLECYNKKVIYEFLEKEFNILNDMMNENIEHTLDWLQVKLYELEGNQ